MSAHYDKYSLNTYRVTPYFMAHCPADYPLLRVLQKCRAFRRLPPHLRELAALAKRWAERIYAQGGVAPSIPDIYEWYDDEGYELNPGTGKRLTDEEIDADWERWGTDEEFEVEDIPVPPGGFADPDTWEPPPDEPDPVDDEDRPTEADVLGWIKSHGRERVAKEYGVPRKWLSKIDSDEELARKIVEMAGKPWPEDDSSTSAAVPPQPRGAKPMPHIRIFPHSRKEFPSLDALTTWLMTALKARGGVYHLRSKDAVAELPPGSIVLFRYGDLVVGEAVVREYRREPVTAISVTGATVEFEAWVRFAADMIRVFAPPVTVPELQAIIGKSPDITVPKGYYIVRDWNVYPKLLAMLTATLGAADAGAILPRSSLPARGTNRREGKGTDHA